jgi:hypothetical protein
MLSIANERKTTMTKKQAGVIAVIAFAALLRPMGNLIEFVDIVWCLAVDGVVSPCWRMNNAILQEFGPTAMYWSRVSFDCIVAAIPALLIYRYLRRRDFTQVCMSCAAHKIRAWTLLVAYLALTLQNSSITVQHVVPFEAEGIPLDEAMEHSPTATLELRLCHPENDRLERELKANGRLTDEVLATAPQIEGYRLMRVRGKDDAVCYVCDDVELSMDDFVSARASKLPFNEGFYEVFAKLTPEGRGRLARLTRDYKPHGAKNSSNQGRALAIVVNGELVVAPIIRAEIDMGEFVITGKFTKEEAIALAAALNSKGGE